MLSNSGAKYGRAIKKLINGLKAKGFVNIFTTDDLFELRNNR